MQVQLKQLEIEAALKAFLVQQGIALAGKTVKIAFTAGRKESGITADLTIDDLDIPGFDESEPVALALAEVVNIKEAVVVETKAPEVVLAVAEPEVEAPAEPDVPADKTASLFG